MVPSVPLPSNGSKKTSSLPNKRQRSYVWHYFNRLGNMVKCRVCQHELKTKEDRSTTELLWHLKQTHGLKHGMIENNFSSLPTKLTQSTNLRLCMRERVLRSFVENSGDIWRCIQCNYAIEDKKILSMFQHLKITHWRASRPAGAFIQINNNQIPENGTEAPEIIETRNLGDKMSLFVDRSAENCRKIAIEEEEDALGGNRLKDSNSVESNLLGENKVEGVEVGSKDGPGNVESAISLDHSYRNEELQSITPMVWEKASSNEQRVEKGYGTLENNVNNRKVLTGDDNRKFDHWYSRKSGKQPVATTSRQINAQKTLPAIQKSCSPRNSRGKIKQKELDSQVEIQVPLQNLPRFNAEIRDTNGETPINYESIKTEKAGKKQNVAVITLSRPKTLNALNIKLMDELNDAVIRFDSDKNIGAIIITGSETAFAAGKDIKEMQNLTYARTINENVLRKWNGISKANKPVIAAVNGYAVGGGCELAMMCDIIYAGENALFGQPEIVIGTIPGAGGTQRLTRVIGKSKAMEMVLTGDEISAVEAEKFGLISRVFPPDQVLSEAIKLGERISAHSPLIVAMAKEAVNSAYETTLQEGLRLEAKLFSGTLATADRREGMAAFLEKRAPNFKNE